MIFFKNPEPKKMIVAEWQEGMRKVSTEKFFFVIQRISKNYYLDENEATFLHKIIDELTEKKVENPDE